MTKQNLIDVLNELKSACLSCKHSDSAVRSLMTKYNMLFLGESINVIYSNDFYFSLQTVFGYCVTMEEFMSLIPPVCSELGMKYEPMYTLSTPDVIEAYRIELW